ncbi:MAG TPA: L-2-hydroxyglutarate oxidase [Solirubrobacteraceae bacterium]|nr:L-2-hydroxyglutarate oxidase [Solirubrobacteraceae bacterium]
MTSPIDDPPSQTGKKPPEHTNGPPSSCDVAVIGGGIVGLAVARELTRRRPKATVCAFEREREVGAHQTGHNSGVIHAGVYYRPGSLKARLCLEGARELYEYCEANQIAHERRGKLILATDQGELGRLEELERRGLANGVPGLRRVDRHEIEAKEPHARAISGLWSPATGVVDFEAVAKAYAEDVREAGGTVATGCEVRRLAARPRSIQVEHARGATQAGQAIVCAGAWSDRLAVSAGASPDPRIVPFRGAYLKLASRQAELVRGLIYPVPDHKLPFLGVHLTKTIDGEALIGPTALIAPARDAYKLGGMRPRDLLDTALWPGTWRMVGREWRSGLTELRHAASKTALVKAAARFVPALRPDDVEVAFAGVRAQAVARDGSLLDDFVFAGTPRALHVRNAPSPGATSALAIAKHIVDEAERAFGLS